MSPGHPTVAGLRNYSRTHSKLIITRSGPLPLLGHRKLVARRARVDIVSLTVAQPLKPDKICHPPVNRTLLSTHTTTVISGLFFYCREIHLLMRGSLAFFWSKNDGISWSPLVLGSGRGFCHAGSLGFER